MNCRKLNHLTSGRTSIVSIPVEQKIDLLTDDFAVLQVNYSILPDLQVGDGEIQVVVANAGIWQKWNIGTECIRSSVCQREKRSRTFKPWIWESIGKLV